MGSMSNNDEVCTNCGYEKATYELFNDLITARRICPKCNFVVELEREVSEYYEGADEENFDQSLLEWKEINTYFEKRSEYMTLGTFSQCLICGRWGEIVGLLENAKDDETYCPYCMTSQKAARELIRIE